MDIAASGGDPDRTLVNRRSPSPWAIANAPRINADIDGFVGQLTTGGDPGTAAYCATDMNDNGALETAVDTALFVTCLLGGPCP